MDLFWKRSMLVILLLVVILQLSGCGETLQGIGRDWGRVGKGVKTIFVREGD